LDFDGGNLGDIVRNSGYDVVVLNFPTYFREEDQALRHEKTRGLETEEVALERLSFLTIA